MLAVWKICRIPGWINLTAITTLVAVLGLMISATTIAQSKPNLVLLPLHVSEDDAGFANDYGAALQEGLQNRYTVFFGAMVEKQLQKEYDKIDCNAEECRRNVAIAFNGDLVADASVKRDSGGYLIRLVVSNVHNGQQVEASAHACKDCSRFDLLPELRRLGGATDTANLVSSQGTQVQVNTEKSSRPSSAGTRSILIFDSLPTGAQIAINGKNVGTTPYQGLTHTLGETLDVEISTDYYLKSSFQLNLRQAITELDTIVLEPAVGEVVIASEPFVSGSQVIIDGQAMGAAPLVTSLNAGNHAIEIKAGKKSTGVKNIIVNAGKNSPFTLPFASPVAVKNFGFEDDYFSDPNGWHFGVKQWAGRKHGVMRFSTAYFPRVASPEGKNVAFLSKNNSWLSQELEETLEPGRTYTLKVRVGRRIEQNFGPGQYRLELYAGQNLLAQKESSLPKAGTFAEDSLEFIAPDRLQSKLKNQPLLIRVTNIDAVQVNLDIMSLVKS